MKKIFTILPFLLLGVVISNQTNAQGCVAIRSTGGMGNTTVHPDEDGGWIFSANNRYFKSFRHFNGTEEQKHRLKEKTEVINYQYALDMVLTRVISSRWSVMIDVPILANKRTHLHGGERRANHSFGLGDIRIAAYRWILDPKKNSKGNFQLGLGIKLPTGDYDYKDFRYNVGPDGERELRNVDQSIQLGDGGTGISTELNAFYNFSDRFGVYGNFYYLSNPREHNGVVTHRRRENEAIMSVPDQYMARVGFNYSYNDIVASLGVRTEGIPVYDLIGGSGEFRRPGYIWSIEPGITYQLGGVQLYATVPVALHRNRTQSVTDKENSILEGEHVQGDAAFADYSVNFGITFHINKKSKMMEHKDTPSLFNHTEDEL